MSLHRKCVIIFLLLCMLLCATQSFGDDLANNNIGEESGEDENLKEALLLVEILKNDYARALRENLLLRQRVVETTTEPPEEPTCASTSRLASSRVTVRAPTTASRATTTRRPATTNRQPSTTTRTINERNLGLMAPFHTDLSRRKGIPNIQINKNFRRRMPTNYLYGSDVLRSLRRQEEVSEDPAASKAPEEGTEAETVTDESDGATNPPEPTEATSVATTVAAVTNAAAAAVETDAPKSENAVKNKDEPVLSQVADELVSEMKGQQQHMLKTTTPGRTRKTTRNTRYLSAIKPTMKIYLSRSTRLAVPFSKNNAFCYFNPRNALCRTSL